MSMVLQIFRLFVSFQDPSELFLSVHLKSSPNKAYKMADDDSTEVLPIGLGTDFSKHLYPEQKV